MVSTNVCIMRSLISIFFLFICFNAFSQTKSGLKITGKITDASTNKPVEYASVGLTDQITNKVVNGSVTDSTGRFQIAGVATGTYKVSIDFIGYQKKQALATQRFGV